MTGEVDATNWPDTEFLPLQFAPEDRHKSISIKIGSNFLARNTLFVHDATWLVRDIEQMTAEEKRVFLTKPEERNEFDKRRLQLMKNYFEYRAYTRANGRAWRNHSTWKKRTIIKSYRGVLGNLDRVSGPINWDYKVFDGINKQKNKRLKEFKAAQKDRLKRSHRVSMNKRYAYNVLMKEVEVDQKRSEARDRMRKLRADRKKQALLSEDNQ
jgi:hypothetical protein